MNAPPAISIPAERPGGVPGAGGGGTITPPAVPACCGPAMGGGAATPPSSRSPSPARPVPRTNAFPDPGNFSGHPDHLMLKNMYDAITRLNLWDWLQNFTPDEGKGFMFSFTPEIQSITVETDAMGHSGASFALCMRHMEKIAKSGWIDYYREIIAPILFRAV